MLAILIADSNRRADPDLWGHIRFGQAFIANRHLIGIDKLMWEADFPHNDSNFPDSRKLLEKALADVPDHEAHQIAELNARSFYDFHQEAGSGPILRL